MDSICYRATFPRSALRSDRLDLAHNAVTRETAVVPLRPQTSDSKKSSRDQIYARKRYHVVESFSKEAGVVVCFHSSRTTRRRVAGISTLLQMQC